MAEDRFSKINLYEPERATLKMRVLTDPPSPLVKEEKGASWFEKIYIKWNEKIIIELNNKLEKYESEKINNVSTKEILFSKLRETIKNNKESYKDIKEYIQKLTDEFYSLEQKIFALKQEIKKINNKLQNKMKRNYREVTLDIVTAPAKKLFDYIDMTVSEIENMKVASDEFLNNSLYNGITDAREIYQGAVKQATKFNDKSDEIIRFILDDLKLEDGFDFIPCLTIDQRKVIVEAFWSVNPILKDAEKKEAEIRREVENIVRISKTLKEVEESTKTN